MKIKWTALIFVVCMGCQSPHTLRVRFDSAGKLKPGDIVLLGNTRIGSVKKVKPVAAGRSTTITIVFDKSTNIPSSSEFVLAYDAFGTPFVSINPDGEQEPIDWQQIQGGRFAIPSDSTAPDRPTPSTDGLRPSKQN